MKSFLEILEESGGVKPGHTIFKNGFHGNGWVEKGFVIRKPWLLDEVTKIQANIIKSNFENVELLVGPITSGSLVTSYIARHLSVPFAVTMGKDIDLEFHRFYKPEENLRTVFIDDLVFSGKDLDSNISFLKKYPLNLLGCSVWIARRELASFEVKTVDLGGSIFDYYKPEECPLCKKGAEIEFKNIRE